MYWWFMVIVSVYSSTPKTGDADLNDRIEFEIVDLYVARDDYESWIGNHPPVIVAGRADQRFCIQVIP
jgi:hypothetical protein